MTVNPYRLARGMRFRRDPDGTATLLVPEGIVALNDTAAAVLELADGKRDDAEIVAALCERYDDVEGTIAADVRSLLHELAERGFLAR